MKARFFKTFATMLLCIVGLSSNASAQDVQMATLQHGETVTTYYGADGLKSAHDAAVAGDQICLSGGTFTSVNITKAVKIYGAGGFVQDVSKNRYKTIISGDFTIELPAGAEGLLIEGICTSNTVTCKGDIVAMTLRKCYFYYLVFKGANTTNCGIEQCEISSFFPDASSKNLVLSNSVVRGINNNSSDAVMSLINCVITYSESSSPTAAMFKNCIMAGRLYSATISYYNCLVCGTSSINSNSIRENVVRVDDYYYNLFTTDGYYQLKDEYKSKVMGTDGTEIGIYGGSTPFSNVPSNPQVTTKSVAGQSDTNGKLKVNMVVEAQ